MTKRVLWQGIVGVALAAFFGAVLAAFNIPLGWLLGAMIGGSIAANVFSEMANPQTLRRTGQFLIGTSAVAVISPSILQSVVGLLPLMFVAAIVANVVGLLLALPFARLAKVDRTTAVLSSLPAGMAEMASLADEMGAKVEFVTWAHTIRVILVILFIPPLIGVTGVVAALPQATDGTVWGLALCLGGGLITAYIAQRVGLLNAFLIAPMSFGIILIAFGVPVAAMPPILLILAQILLGFALGARLKLQRFTGLVRQTVASVVCSAGLIAFMLFVFAPFVSRWAELDNITAVLSVAPGGLGEMVAAANFSGASVGIVAGFQFARSFLTNIVVPPLVKFKLNRSP